MAKKKAQIQDSKIKSGFSETTIMLPLDQIVPLKIISSSIHRTPKYLQILASIRAIGIIEPPVVTKDPKNKTLYILLDGHLRIEALKEIKETEVLCLVSTDDEAFTYNKHINRLSTIMEHKMILRTIERGVSEERIAEALNLNVKNIIAKRNLLNGICAPAAELLKEKNIAASVFPILRRMKEVRQIEAVTLMGDAGIYSASYAKALLAATPKDQLIDPGKPKNIKGLDEEQMARMESEMESLQREYRIIEENYGTDVLNLTLTKAWLSKLLNNARVVKFMTQNYPDFLSQFQDITEMKSIGGKDVK